MLENLPVWFNLSTIVQSLKEWWIPPDFLIYILVCTAQTAKGVKTNDVPLKSPIKLQQKRKKNCGNF